MAIVRTIQCSICGKQETESKQNEGWNGWGQLSGIALDGDANPCLCPEHLALVASYIDEVKHGVD